MHRNGIVHRDLKLENWLMQTPGDTTGVKLIDFGLSKHFAQDQNMQQAVGSTYYVAPGKTSQVARLGFLSHFRAVQVNGGVTMHVVAFVGRPIGGLRSSVVLEDRSLFCLMSFAASAKQQPLFFVTLCRSRGNQLTASKFGNHLVELCRRAALVLGGLRHDD